ncbi:MAG: cobalamin-dependent protein [Proteobacteria bacterium]|nr:cobalamin-dependent protein [Pseudomonadota bacterium]
MERNSDRKIRIIMAKVGVDIHERGALTLMQVFKDEGMEVIYTGRYATPEQVAKATVEEGADLVALSDSTGSMLIIAKQVIEALKKYDMDHIPIVAGGLIPKESLAELEALGVTGNFGPGTPFDTIVDHVRSVVSK